MPKTDLPSSGSTDVDRASTDSGRPGWLIPVVILVVIVLAAAIVWIVVASGDDTAAPQEVVEANIAADNARDAEAFEATMDPEIIVTFDGSAVGFDDIPAVTGRDAVVEGAVEYWEVLDPIVTYEVLSATGSTVVVETVATVSGGDSTRHEVTYEVSDDGLIVTEHHVILE